MKRWATLALLLLLPLTMAPRTSQVLDNGWQFSGRNTGATSEAPTSTYVLILTQNTGPDVGPVAITITDAEWVLVAASPECTEVDALGVLCTVDFTPNRNYVTVTVTVRTEKGAQVGFTPLAR